MNFPLSFTVLAAAGQVSRETSFEFFLNRLGINIIEGPKENIWGEIGSTLRLIFKNRGAPTHITISSPNSGMYTDFFHENMYIVDEAVLSIPLRNESPEGFFDLEIITGYGGVKTSLHVDVIQGVHHQKSCSKGRTSASAGCPWAAPSSDDHDGYCPDPLQRVALYEN